jgi:hypothetical protein
MPKLQHYTELERTLRIAAQNAPPGVPTAQIAEQFYDGNQKLVEPLIRGWIIARLVDACTELGLYRYP